MSELRELIVEGTPRSLQGSGRGITAWKKVVMSAASQQLAHFDLSIQFVDVGVRIVHFTHDWGANDGDLDNIAKPILDALRDSPGAFFNDNQVKELLLRRIEWGSKNISNVENASPTLAQRLEAAVTGAEPRDFVYIAITTALALERLP
jgi:hypothetical protein